jgi:hypothetical protein
MAAADVAPRWRPNEIDQGAEKLLGVGADTIQTLSAE